MLGRETCPKRHEGENAIMYIWSLNEYNKTKQKPLKAHWSILLGNGYHNIRVTVTQKQTENKNG